MDYNFIISLKYSSCRRSLVEDRFSYFTILRMKRTKGRLTLHSSAISQGVFGAIVLKLIFLQSGIFVIEGQFSMEGSPKNLAMRESCSIQLLPLKRGEPVASSIRMHPMLQISASCKYFRQPQSISGHLYHRVKPSISYSCPFEHQTADPKSQMASCPFSRTTRLEGFRSRWMI